MRRVLAGSLRSRSPLRPGIDQRRYLTSSTPFEQGRTHPAPAGDWDSAATARRSSRCTSARSRRDPGWGRPTFTLTCRGPHAVNPRAQEPEHEIQNQNPKSDLCGFSSSRISRYREAWPPALPDGTRSTRVRRRGAATRRTRRRLRLVISDLACRTAAPRPDGECLAPRLLASPRRLRLEEDFPQAWRPLPKHLQAVDRPPAGHPALSGPSRRRDPAAAPRVALLQG